MSAKLLWKWMTMSGAAIWALIALFLILDPEYELMKVTQIIATIYVVGVFLHWYRA